MKSRYPFAPVVTIILQVVAVLLFLALGYITIRTFGSAFASWSKGGFGQFGQQTPPVAGFLPRLESLLQPLLFLVAAFSIPAILWAIGDGLDALTRGALAPAASAASTTPPATAGGDVKAE